MKKPKKEQWWIEYDKNANLACLSQGVYRDDSDCNGKGNQMWLCEIKPIRRSKGEKNDRRK